jgi:hypothetical protein
MLSYAGWKKCGLRKCKTLNNTVVQTEVTLAGGRLNLAGSASLTVSDAFTAAGGVTLGITPLTSGAALRCEERHDRHPLDNLFILNNNF